MKDPSALLVSHCQYRHFHRDDAAFSVVVHHLRADVPGGDQLAHKPIIVNMNIIDQAVDAVILIERGTHKRTEGWGFQLRDRTTRDKLRSA
jgi:hypothetical protein